MDVPTPETLKCLQSVLEETWESLMPEERARTSKTQVAAHILQVAAAGERDPVRLRAEAVTEVFTLRVDRITCP
jgi:hypothetical protein